MIIAVTYTEDVDVSAPGPHIIINSSKLSCVCALPITELNLHQGQLSFWNARVPTNPILLLYYLAV